MNDKPVRVGAILGTNGDDKTVRFLGYGLNLGEEIPPSEDDGGPVGGTADLARELGHTSPKIVLDSGETVWGCECWWAKKDVLDQHLDAYRNQGYTIVHTSITDFRKDFHQRLAQKMADNYVAVALIVASVGKDGRIIKSEQIPIFNETPAPDSLEKLQHPATKEIAQMSLRVAAATVRRWLGQNTDQDSA